MLQNIVYLYCSSTFITINAGERSLSMLLAGGEVMSGKEVETRKMIIFIKLT